MAQLITNDLGDFDLVLALEFEPEKGPSRVKVSEERAAECGAMQHRLCGKDQLRPDRSDATVQGAQSNIAFADETSVEEFGAGTGRIYPREVKRVSPLLR